MSQWIPKPSDIRLYESILGTYERVLSRSRFGMTVNSADDGLIIEWHEFCYKLYVTISPSQVFVTVTNLPMLMLDPFFEASFDRARLGKIKKSALVLAKKIINRPVREVMLK